MVPPKYPDPKSLYDDLGNRPDHWATWGRELYDASRRLRSEVQTGLPDGTELMVLGDAVSALLLGYAAECTLKGTWLSVKPGRQLVKDGKYLGIDGAGDHELFQLAQAAEVQFLSGDEANALKRLSPFIVFAGRYPISTTVEAMQATRVGGGEPAVPGFFSRAEFAAADALVRRLLGMLRYRTFYPAS